MFAGHFRQRIHDGHGAIIRQTTNLSVVTCDWSRMLPCTRYYLRPPACKSTNCPQTHAIFRTFISQASTAINFCPMVTDHSMIHPNMVKMSASSQWWPSFCCSSAQASACPPYRQWCSAKYSHSSKIATLTDQLAINSQLLCIKFPSFIPHRSRAYATGLVAALSYLFAFIGTKTFYNLEVWLTLPGVIYLYGVIGFIG